MSTRKSRHNILHLGAGNVGAALVQQVQTYGPDFTYCGLFTIDAGLFESQGLSAGQIADFPGRTTASAAAGLEEIPLPFILVDTTASGSTLPLLKRALERGGSVVMSNKKPLSGSYADFAALHQLGAGRLFYETTVGAGLPVIQTLRTLLATGDDVTQIQGCFSGTLGFIFSQIEQGSSFSAAVLEAKRLGFTEPNPRDDLSGLDVARKALILSRMLGHKTELADIRLEKLYPGSMESLPPDQFLEALPSLDQKFNQKAGQARSSGQVLRYVATIRRGGCSVGLEAVDSASDIGALRGADSLVVFKTKRYAQTPMVIKGPGAGVEVTAAGVFGDLILAASRG